MSARINTRFWIGLVISAVFLFLAIRNVEWPDVLNAWQSARLLPLAVGLALLIGAWGVAAVRWRLILAPAPHLRVRDTFAYIMIGFLANTVLPFRLGELARVTLMGRQRNIGISRTLGSVALERVMDLLSLVVIILILGLVMDIPPVVQAGITTMSGSGIVLILSLTMLAFHQDRLQKLIRWCNRFIPEKWTRRPSVLLGNFSRGVVVIKNPLHVSGVFLLTLIVRCFGGSAVLLWLYAFNLPVPWYGAFFILVVVNLGSAIPSSPGYIGVYHYLAVLALSLWVPDRGPALAYAIGTHAINMLANVTLGAYFLAREGVSLESLKSEVGWKQSGEMKPDHSESGHAGRKS